MVEIKLITRSIEMKCSNLLRRLNMHWYTCLVGFSVGLAAAACSLVLEINTVNTCLLVVILFVFGIIHGLVRTGNVFVLCLSSISAPFVLDLSLALFDKEAGLLWVLLPMSALFIFFIFGSPLMLGNSIVWAIRHRYIISRAWNDLSNGTMRPRFRDYFDLNG